MQTETLAIDFGTSNSAAAVMEGNAIRRIPIEAGAETLPTAVFFPVDGGGMRIGSAAAAALIEGEEGRYMRALKSVLGLPLLHEKRPIGGRRRTLAEIVTVFLAELRQRAEAEAGRPFRRALSGRPVHFHTNDAARDATAEADLRACYLAAGFDEVSFLPEPEAAAIASHGLGGGAGLGLIVDIGGGTSDFTVFRSSMGRAEILASHGIRLGGTDFDHAVSMETAMPELGLGGELNREVGSGRVPVPRAPFAELATWAKIPFLYTAETRRLVAGLVRSAVDRPRMERFATVLDLELGHELAFAVERGKIAANSGAAGAAIDMGFIEPGLAAALDRAALDAMLDANRAELGAAVHETLALAGVGTGEIGRIVLVGGSSLMGFVADEMCRICPGASVVRSEAFTAVVDGLALATRP